MHLEFSFFKFVSKFALLRSKHQQRLTFCLVTSRTPAAMNIGFDIFRAISLHNPIYSWKVESTRSNICGEEASVFLFLESEKNRHSFLGTLTSM
jgi:hypothetical protein